jgi:hypothetical protein
MKDMTMNINKISRSQFLETSIGLASIPSFGLGGRALGK